MNGGGQPGLAKVRRRRRSGGTQARGRVRRQVILEAAREVLRQTSLKDLTYTDICRRANVPTASAYHFFPNKFVIVEALVEELSPAFYAAVRRPIPPDVVHTWQDVIQVIFAWAVEFLNSDSSAREIFLGGHVPPEIRNETRKRDRSLGRFYQDRLSEFFVLPLIPNSDDVFYIFVQAVEAVYSLSQLEHGRITPFMADEAYRLGIAYLGHYLPPALPRRTDAVAPRPDGAEPPASAADSQPS